VRHQHPVIIQPGVAIESHRCEDTEEVYYILHRKVRVKVRPREEDVGPGEAIYIPVKKEHSLNNTGRLPLWFICVVAKIDKK